MGQCAQVETKTVSYITSVARIEAMQKVAPDHGVEVVWGGYAEPTGVWVEIDPNVNESLSPFFRDVDAICPVTPNS